MDHESQPQQGQRLGFSFHRTFSCVRPAVAQILSLAEETGQESERTLDNRTIREKTSLGTIYVEAMPRYAIGAGLLDFHRELTEFGRYAATHDPMLEQRGTQWLMHYHFSAPHGPGPAFWNSLVDQLFFVGRRFSSTEAAERITQHLLEAEGRELSEKTVGKTVTAFAGTYTKSDGLGNLGILAAVERDWYQVTQPVIPPVWAVGYALLDYWSANFTGQLTVSLDTLTAPGGFTSLFFLTQSDFDEVLQAFQSERYIEVYRGTPPEQVVLLQTEGEPVLQKLYGTR